MTDLKKGDKAIVVDPNFLLTGKGLHKGSLVTIAWVEADEMDPQMVTIEELPNERFFSYRFQKVNETQPNNKTMKQPRLPNGRFTSVTPAAPAVTQFNKPLTLKRGSLYRVVGGSVGRYVGGDVTVHGESFVSISVHGKVQAVKRSLVRKADKEDVQAYLDTANA